MSWLWWSNKAYAVDETTGPRIIPNTYSFAVSQAVEVFKNTNLKAGQGPNGEGKVKFVSGSFGLFRKPAWARVWSGPIECTIRNSQGHYLDSGICDKNFRRADRAIVTFNTTHLRHKNTVILKLSALHEICHVFGLGHPAQNCPSFMTPLVTTFNPQSLSPQEHQYINSSY